MKLTTPDEAPRRGYSLGLRDEQQALTRRRILDALAGLIEQEDLADVPYARVAAAAGVSEATVYRHFPNKPALMRSLWTRINEAVGLPAVIPETLDAVLAIPGQTFPAFDARPQLMVRALRNELGREARIANLRELRQRLDSTLEREFPQQSAAWRAQLAAVLGLCASARPWEFLREFSEFTAEETIPAMEWAMRAALEQARREARRNPNGADSSQNNPTSGESND